MSSERKRRLLLYGLLLGAVHFTITALCGNARLLLQRPEDMIGSGGTKPYWPPNPMADSLERVAEILRLPSGWLWTPSMPDAITVFLFAANSFVWGFLIVVLVQFLLTRLRFHHESRIA